MSRTAARLIAGLALTLALFWTVVLAVSLSIAWFWRVTSSGRSSCIIGGTPRIGRGM